MEVTNQMLSLTGSLLQDPTNPPPLPETHTIPYRSPSVESEMEIDTQPVKRPKKSHTQSKPPRTSHAATAATSTVIPTVGSSAPYDANLQPNPAAAPTKVIDERFLSAREVKQLRKEEARRKRDARKERKEGEELEQVMAAGGEQMVDVNPSTAAAQNYDEEVGGEGGTGYGTAGGSAAGGKRKAGDEGKSGEKRKKRAE